MLLGHPQANLFRLFCQHLLMFIYLISIVFWLLINSEVSVFHHNLFLPLILLAVMLLQLFLYHVVTRDENCIEIVTG